MGRTLPFKSAHVAWFGNRAYAMNQLGPAASIFAQLLDADPENATYAILLGKSCTLMPDSIKECEKLERFAATDPKHAEVDTYAAMSILARSPETANLTLAAKLLDEAIEADPKLPEAHLQKGFLLQSQDRWQESIPELEASAALRPESSKAHYLLMLAYSRTGKREKAQEEMVLQKSTGHRKEKAATLGTRKFQCLSWFRHEPNGESK